LARGGVYFSFLAEMQYLKDLVQQLGTIIASEADPPNVNYKNGVVLDGGGHHHHHISIPLSSSSSDADEPPENEERYASDSEANEAFVRSYWEYMRNSFGREPTHRTDLYCGMIPVDIVLPSGESYRFWWLPVTHPFATVLRNTAIENNSSEGLFDSGSYGLFVVYENSVIEYCINSYMEVCQDFGFTLLPSESLYAKLTREEDEAHERSHTLVDLQQQRAPSPPPPMQNNAIETPPYKPPPRSEGSKKAD